MPLGIFPQIACSTFPDRAPKIFDCRFLRDKGRRIALFFGA